MEMCAGAEKDMVCGCNSLPLQTFTFTCARIPYGSRNHKSLTATTQHIIFSQMWNAVAGADIFNAKY